MNRLDLPFRPDARGRSAGVPDDAWVRDLIEQVLFTAPGERVNRPDFGSGILQLVFAPNSGTLAAALQVSVQASLQRWLGDLIDVEAVAVTAEEERLEITIRYALRRTQERGTATFTQPLP